MSKTTMYLIGGAIAYYFLARRSAPVVPVRVGVPAPLPTDSMMPGSMPASTQGLVKDYSRQAANAQMMGLGFFGQTAQQIKFLNSKQGQAQAIRHGTAYQAATTAYDKLMSSSAGGLSRKQAQQMKQDANKAMQNATWFTRHGVQY